MPIFEPGDFTDPARFHHKCESIICPVCRETGVIIVGPATDSDILEAQCLHCGEGIETIAALDPNAFGAGSQGSYMKGTEKQLRTRLTAALSPEFEVIEEAWLRDPGGVRDFRVDLLVVPQGELAERLPFTCVGVEVKPEPVSFRHQSHALKQCIDYKEAIIHDQRVPHLRSTSMPCVALYQGRWAKHRGELPRFDGGCLMRTMGLMNIGEFLHEERHRLSLLISLERIWSKRDGTSDAKAGWPVTRPKGSQ